MRLTTRGGGVSGKALLWRAQVNTLAPVPPSAPGGGRRPAAGRRRGPPGPTGGPGGQRSGLEGGGGGAACRGEPACTRCRGGGRISAAPTPWRRTRAVRRVGPEAEPRRGAASHLSHRTATKRPSAEPHRRDTAAPWEERGGRPGSEVDRDQRWGSTCCPSAPGASSDAVTSQLCSRRPHSYSHSFMVPS